MTMRNVHSVQPPCLVIPQGSESCTGQSRFLEGIHGNLSEPFKHYLDRLQKHPIPPRAELGIGLR